MKIMSNPATRFHENIIDLTIFLGEVIKRCYNDGYTKIKPDVISSVGGIISNFQPRVIIDTFTVKSYDHWDSIMNNNEDFFKKNCTKVFEDLPEEYVGAFRDLFDTYDTNGKSVITSDEKESIWAYFESFVKISIKYVHEERRPTSEGISPKPKFHYRKKFLPEVKLLTTHAKKYNVKLQW